jgi:hypothetical protein
MTFFLPILAALQKPPVSERSAALETIRPAFTRAFRGQKVKFIVREFGTARGWTFLGVDPVAPSGRPLDFARSEFADLKRDGMIGGPAYFLLHKVKGRWQTVEEVYFPTDVAWLDWPSKHSAAPRTIFPSYGRPR